MADAEKLRAVREFIADRGPAAVVRAIEEWMDQAPSGDAEWIVRELDDRASDWGDWGTAPKSHVLSVLERCMQRGVADGVVERLDDGTIVVVKFYCVAANNRLGDFQVDPPPYAAAASAREKEMWASGLMFRAGPSFHTIAKINPDRYALLVHGGGIQELAREAQDQVLQAASAARAERGESAAVACTKDFLQKYLDGSVDRLASDCSARKVYESDAGFQHRVVRGAGGRSHLERPVTQ